MSVGSVSFWQTDQNYWARAQQATASRSLSSAVISGMFGATTTLSQGLSSIANQTALTRVNSQLSAAVQSALTGVAPTSSTTNPTAGATAATSSPASTSSSAAPVAPSPALALGTASLTSGTSLFTLGILRGGSVTVTAGAGTTKYVSTGTDTVGDLINAINVNASTKANVAAGLNSQGQLTITAQNSSDLITIGGLYAPNVGFGTGNTTFSPTAGSPASTTNPAAATGSSSTAGSSTTTSAAATTPSTASGIATNSAFALQTVGSAAILLASSGIAGSVVDLLA